MRSHYFDRALNIALVLGVLALAGARIRTSFFDDRPTVTNARSEYISFWREALEIGTLVAGPSDAPVSIVVFIDYECPACAGFHRDLHDALSELEGQVSVITVHYPLRMHRFALPAARAMECATDAEQRSALANLFYLGQDSLGLKPWSSFARQAGIIDTLAIQACAVAPGPVEAIDAGVALGDRMNALGTPTVLINGWKLSYVPNRIQIVDLVRAALNGENPT